MTDDTLVNRTLAGDRDAFRELVTRYRNAVYGLAVSYVRNFDDAEDLAQEAFIRSYYRLPDLEKPARYGGWVKTITANLCRMELRRRASLHGDLADVDPDALPSSSHSDEHDERAATFTRVLEALGSLPEGERQAVSLYYLGEENIEQVSRFLGVSESAVKVRLHRARKRLRKEMVDMAGKTLSKRKLKPGFADEIGIHKFGDLTQLTDDELKSLARPLADDMRSLAYALSADDGESRILKERLLEILPEMDRNRLLIHLEFYERYSPFDDYKNRVVGAAQALQIDGTIRRPPQESAKTGVLDLQTFKDLAALVDREMQWLLREMDSKDLVIAFCDTSRTLNALKARVWGNVSQRVSRLIKLEIANSAPSRREIRQMQGRIMNTARDLQIRGLIRPGNSPATAPSIDIRDFEDLVLLTDREAQHVLRQVDTKTLATAIRGRGKGIPAVKKMFMSNLSRRVGKMIDEHRRSTRPKPGEIPAARAEMVTIAHDLQTIRQIRPASRKPTKAQFERVMVKAVSAKIDRAVHGQEWSPRQLTDLVSLLAIELPSKGFTEAAERHTGMMDPVFRRGLALLGEGENEDKLVETLERAATDELKRMEREYQRVISGMAGIAKGEDPRTICERMTKL